MFFRRLSLQGSFTAIAVCLGLILVNRELDQRIEEKKRVGRAILPRRPPPGPHARRCRPMRSARMARAVGWTGELAVAAARRVRRGVATSAARRSVRVAMDERSHFATLVIDRPEAHNALSPAVMDGIVQGLGGLAAEPELRAVFVRSEGPTFCAGGDLKHMRATADYAFEENVREAMVLSGVFDALRSFPRPTIAMVHGNAFGGGIGIISACDMAFGVEGALFALSEVALGVIPATISPYVIERIGVNACRRYFLTAERFGAPEAMRIGLLSGVEADADALDRREAALRKQLLRVSPGAVAASKRLIFGAAGRPIDTATRQWTAERLAEARDAPEGREGMSAFIEKRPASWVQSQ